MREDLQQHSVPKFGRLTIPNPIERLLSNMNMLEWMQDNDASQAAYAV